MSNPTPSICLAMIVRDESATIERALTAALPFVDYWCIHDLGSTDDTIDLIDGFSTSVPGSLEQHSFCGFAESRNRLLQQAAKHGDWILVLDADEELQCLTETIRLPSQAKIGAVTIEESGYNQRQPRLFHASELPRYVGRVAEYPEFFTPTEVIEHLQIKHHSDGVRHKDLEPTAKSIHLIQEELAAQPENTKLIRALAMAYLKVGKIDHALERFSQILTLESCAQDTWFAHYMLGNLAERSEDINGAIEHFSAGLDLNPDRVECSYGLARQKAASDQSEEAIALCREIAKAKGDPKADYFEPEIQQFKAALLGAEQAVACDHFDVTREFTALLDENLPPHHPAREKMATLNQQCVQPPKSKKTTPSLATPEQSDAQNPRLTVGMATHDDFHGTYFSIISIVLYHREVLDEIEILVIDNNPESQHGLAVKGLCERVAGCRYVAAGEYTGTAVRERIFAEAKGEFILCMDCHVFLHSGTLKRLLDYFQTHPNSHDLIHGPLYYDSHEHLSTHMEPNWRQGFYGTWATDERGKDKDAEPFDIPMQGMGMFSCRKAAWPGFNLKFRGFGGEEGYIHEKFRQRGGRVLCLPFLRWTHRFERPDGTNYPNVWNDRIRNYLIGFAELNLDTTPILEHFRNVLGFETAGQVNRAFLQERRSPAWRFEAIYCVAESEEEWQAATVVFGQLANERVVQRLNSDQQLQTILKGGEQLPNSGALVFWANAICEIESRELTDWIESIDAQNQSSATLRTGLKAPRLQYLAAAHVGRESFDDFSKLLSTQIRSIERCSQTPLTYVVSYWLDPTAPPEREQALRQYFDLQVYTKSLFGAEQRIYTNIDYPGSIQLDVPHWFTPKHGMYAKHIGLQQALREGCKLPICVHDHDLFLKAPLIANPTSVRCNSAPRGKFSDQILIFPPAVNRQLDHYLQELLSENGEFAAQSGYGTEVRHEGLYSTEVAALLIDPSPFNDVPITTDIATRDLVSYEILNHHSLDEGECPAALIPSHIVAVHGHLNKGPITDVLVDWIASD